MTHPKLECNHEKHPLEKTHLDSLLKPTPLQLAHEMAECRRLYCSAEDDEALDHWRGEYEFTKRRYKALVEQLKKRSAG